MEINLPAHFYKLEDEGMVIVALRFGLSRPTCNYKTTEGRVCWAGKTVKALLSIVGMKARH